MKIHTKRKIQNHGQDKSIPVLQAFSTENMLLLQNFYYLEGPFQMTSCPSATESGRAKIACSLSSPDILWSPQNQHPHEINKGIYEIRLGASNMEKPPMGSWWRLLHLTRHLQVTQRVSNGADTQKIDFQGEETKGDRGVFWMPASLGTKWGD